MQNGIIKSQKKEVGEDAVWKRIKCKAQNQKRTKERCVSFKSYFY